MDIDLDEDYFYLFESMSRCVGGLSIFNGIQYSGSRVLKGPRLTMLNIASKSCEIMHF